MSAIFGTQYSFRLLLRLHVSAVVSLHHPPLLTSPVSSLAGLLLRRVT